LALTKAQSEKRKVKSESAKRKRVLTPLVSDTANYLDIVKSATSWQLPRLQRS